MRFYTTMRLGPKRFKTPEGFLVCQDVPIARTGVQLYGPNEIPVTPDVDGVIRVDRDPEEVFRPETIASANGKAFVNEHPSEDVTPLNWRELAKGHLANPHRGSDAEDDLLLVDIVVTDPVTIDGIERNEKTGISCGYDCYYEEIEPGHGRQTNILINHAAWVNRPRCGPRCSIGDHLTTDCEYAKPCSCHERTEDMTTKINVMDLLRKAFKAKDEAELEQIAKDAIATHDGMNMHVPGYLDADTFQAHVAQNASEHQQIRDSIEGLRKEMGELKGTTDKKSKDEAEEHERKVEGEIKAEAPAGTGDSALKAKDSVILEDSFRDTAALAEILSPGIRIPTFDKAMDREKGLDAIHGLRVTALESIYNSADKAMVDEVLAGKPFEPRTMTRDSCRNLFRAVAAIRKRANNKDSATAAVISVGGGLGVVGSIQTPGDLNKVIREKYRGKAA